MLAIALRLHFRNPLALLYSYLFPTLFLLVFYVLYRYDQVPLVRHMGELLTVTVLGGACFGLPTALVSERERGVWRRYRLVPVPIRELVASTLVARYVLLLLAGLLQLALAMMLGMPVPQHPFDLWVAFTAVAFAFLGLGLVIAMLANTVPAVQALGQCLFLPLLVIGGIAVPLGSLPAWAQRVASFFPGRYAVDAIQAAVTGPGLGGVRFSVLALLVIGAAACVAGARLFRWDPRQRIATTAGVGWVGVALAAWLAVGLVNEMRRSPRPGARASAATTTTSIAPPPVSPRPPLTPTLSAEEKRAQEKRQPPPSEIPPARRQTTTTIRPEARPDPPASTARADWRGVTRADIDRDIAFGDLPPDSGIVTPIADPGEPPEPTQVDLFEYLRKTLPGWAPGRVTDPVQRTRNYLYVAGVADIQQLTLERHIPLLVFERLRADTPSEDLTRILYWIAVNPEEGSTRAIEELGTLRLDAQGVDTYELRNRAAIYAAKLLQRLLASG